MVFVNIGDRNMMLCLSCKCMVVILEWFMVGEENHCLADGIMSFSTPKLL